MILRSPPGAASTETGPGEVNTFWVYPKIGPQMFDYFHHIPRRPVTIVRLERWRYQYERKLRSCLYKFGRPVGNKVVISCLKHLRIRAVGTTLTKAMQENHQRVLKGIVFVIRG